MKALLLKYIKQDAARVEYEPIKPGDAVVE
jgi:hypothetical protein